MEEPASPQAVPASRLQPSSISSRFGVIPTPVRLDVHPDFTGRGVTMAFLDSGFYRHPDLTEPENRIVAFHDTSQRRASLTTWGKPRPWDWHGTQTSVTAAGNGYLSNGLYRSIAPEARVVLVKVGSEGRISDEHIARGLEWVIANRERYNIRIVNASLGGDENLPVSMSVADQAAEEAIRQGIVVVAAAGNSGCTLQHHTKAPGNAPSAVTVGGYDDGNVLDNAEPGTYCSSFGLTPDGIVKPEVIAPAIWIAAPILPDTPQFERAAAFVELAAQPDWVLAALASGQTSRLGETTVQAWQTAALDGRVDGASAETVRSTIEQILQEDKVVASYYQHVDGTSFAAPIVSSVVAQMLEANSGLSPRVVKHLLISTAVRIGGAPLLWQGYGVVQARKVVELAGNFKAVPEERYFSPPRIRGDKLIFYYHDHEAQSVALVGDFNRWNSQATPLKQHKNGIWKVQLDQLPEGRYRYKFLIDGNRWVEDPSNGLKEPDDHGGFNSILEVGAVDLDPNWLSPPV